MNSQSHEFSGRQVVKWSELVIIDDLIAVKQYDDAVVGPDMIPKWAEYLNELYGVAASDPGNFDLVLNTDRFTVNEALALILDAMQQAGYELTPEILRAAQA